MKRFLLLSLLGAMLLFSGCAITSNGAKVVPHHQPSALTHFYVLHSPGDERRIDKVIAEVLTAKGYRADYGDAPVSGTDVLVTYEDRWFWDMANYMLRLNIEFRDPATRYPIVAGETIRTSLARKTSEGMAIETLDAMFEKIK
jgi:uncharacterized lipoprotein YajG